MIIVPSKTQYHKAYYRAHREACRIDRRHKKASIGLSGPVRQKNGTVHRESYVLKKSKFGDSEQIKLDDYFYKED